MKYISPLYHWKAKTISVTLIKAAAVGETVLNVSIVGDEFLFPNQILQLQGAVSQDGRYITTYLPGQVQETQQIILEKPLDMPVTVSSKIIYMSTFSVENDNDLMTQSDAVRRLNSVENIYPIGKQIDQPQNYSDCGKPGLIDAESFNKLNRLNKYVEFDSISFSANVLQTIALIKCDADYRLKTSIEIKQKSSIYLGVNLSLDSISFNDGETSQYLEISHFELKANLVPRIAFSRERLMISGVMTHFIRVKFGFTTALSGCEISIGVNKFENLLNQKKISEVAGVIETKPILFDKKEINDLMEGVIGYTSQSRYTLTMSGESPTKPIEILNGDLNSYTVAGFFFCKKANSGKIGNRPPSEKGQNVFDDVPFQLNVSVDGEGHVKQEYSYMELPSSAKLPRIFYRINNGGWSTWSEIGQLEHSHRLEDMVSTDNSLHFTKVLKTTYDNMGTTINGIPLKIIVPTPNHLPVANSNPVGTVVSVETPTGLWMCQVVNGTKTWVNKTIEALKTFTKAVRQTEAGLISPELYDEWNLNGIGKHYSNNGKTIFHHISTTPNKYNSVNNAYDLVPRITQTTIGEKSIAFGWGTTLAGGDNSIALGENTLVRFSYGIGIGYGNTINQQNGIGIGLNLISGNNYVIGKNNIANSSRFIIGDGSSDDNRRNIFEIDDNSIAKAESFAKFTPNRGKDYAHAMLEDGSGLNIDLLGKQVDIDRLYQEKITRGANFKVAFYGVDDSVNEAFILLDPDMQSKVVPNGKVWFDAGGNGITPETIKLQPDSDNGACIIIPAIYSTTGVEKIVLATLDSSDSYLPINVLPNINAQYKADFPIHLTTVFYGEIEYVLTYSNGVKVVYFAWE